MVFATDQQTLDDLKIFDKYGSNSVFSIFNKTVTRGGATVLEEMFRYPLTNATAINQRSKIFGYFANVKLTYPFQHIDFNAIEQYLSNTDERTKLLFQEHSTVKKLTNFIATDAETITIRKGIIALTELLISALSFLSDLNLETGNSYEATKAAINLLLAEPALAIVFNRRDGTKLSESELSAYDIIFRFAHKNIIEALLRHMYKLDVYITVAKVATEREFVLPEAVPSQQHSLIIKDLYHPHVTHAVTNTFQSNSDSNVIFLTGANMAGKSTFMKSLGVALYLAHLGFPVAASEMQFSVFDGIYTTINLSDDLGLGASHFYAEVLRIKKIAHEMVSKNLFVVFDELFRGTNVKDACEATIAFTEAFADRRNSLFVISTHIIEAGEVLKERCNHINFVYLPTLMNGPVPQYTYKLAQGLTADRHGMLIINNEGILDILKAGLKNQIDIN